MRAACTVPAIRAELDRWALPRLEAALKSPTTAGTPPTGTPTQAATGNTTGTAASNTGTPQTGLPAQAPTRQPTCCKTQAGLNLMLPPAPPKGPPLPPGAQPGVQPGAVPVQPEQDLPCHQEPHQEHPHLHRLQLPHAAPLAGQQAPPPGLTPAQQQAWWEQRDQNNAATSS